MYAFHTDLLAVSTHRYCDQKGVTPPSCVRSISRAALASVSPDVFVPGDGDVFIVPVYQQDADGIPTLTSLEFITTGGEKMFLPSGSVRGGFCTLGDDTSASIIAIVEGFATGGTVNAATGWPVVVAFFASNLRLVAEAIRARHPSATIVIAADRDDNKVGHIAGAEAAAAVGGLLAVSPVESDFNDLQAAEGLEAVAAALHAVVPAPGIWPCRARSSASAAPEYRARVCSLPAVEFPGDFEAAGRSHPRRHARFSI
jgi:putative DNA primase/helicase